MVEKAKKSGRIASARITGVGIVSVPASGKQFAKKDLHSSLNLKESTEETVPMSYFKNLLKGLSDAIQMDEKETAKSGEAHAGESSSTGEPVTPAAAPAAAVVSGESEALKSMDARIAALEKGFADSKNELAEITEASKSLIEAVTSLAGTVKESQQNTQKSFGEFQANINILSESVKKANNSVPASPDLGGSNSQTKTEKGEQLPGLSEHGQAIHRIFGKEGVFADIAKEAKRFVRV